LVVAASATEVPPVVEVLLAVIIPAAIAAVIHVFLTVFTRQVLSLRKSKGAPPPARGVAKQPRSGMCTTYRADLREPGAHPGRTCGRKYIEVRALSKSENAERGNGGKLGGAKGSMMARATPPAPEIPSSDPLAPAPFRIGLDSGRPISVPGEGSPLAGRNRGVTRPIAAAVT
jgi:hypothetical protein